MPLSATRRFTLILAAGATALVAGAAPATASGPAAVNPHSPIWDSQPIHYPRTTANVPDTSVQVFRQKARGVSPDTERFCVLNAHRTDEIKLPELTVREYYSNRFTDLHASMPGPGSENCWPSAGLRLGPLPDGTGLYLYLRYISVHTGLRYSIYCTYPNGGCYADH